MATVHKDREGPPECQWHPLVPGQTQFLQGDGVMHTCQPPTISFFAGDLMEQEIVGGKGGVIKARHDFTERRAAIEASMPQGSEDHTFMRSFSIAELLASVVTPGWLIDGILPDTGLTMIHGAAKVGKTTILMSWLKALERDGEWAGKASVGTPVLYLSEEGGNTLAEPIEEMHLDHDSHHLIAPIEYAPEGWDWIATLAHATLHAAAVGARLIIIDTMQVWAGVEDTNSYAETTTIMMVARAASRVSELPILLTHHDRKAGGNEVDSAMGSAGLVAGPDHIIKLSGQKGTDLRELHLVSRFCSSEKSLTLTLANGVFSTTGETAESRTVESIELAYIGAHAAALFTAKELADKWKVPLGTAKGTIKRGIETGQLTEYPPETGEGRAKKYGKAIS